jgi:hypothetical protein
MGLILSGSACILTLLESQIPSFSFHWNLECCFFRGSLLPNLRTVSLQNGRITRVKGLEDF